jgi:hypothetical protein
LRSDSSSLARVSVPSRHATQAGPPTGRSVTGPPSNWSKAAALGTLAIALMVATPGSSDTSMHTESPDHVPNTWLTGPGQPET